MSFLRAFNNMDANRFSQDHCVSILTQFKIAQQLPFTAFYWSAVQFVPLPTIMVNIAKDIL